MKNFKLAFAAILGLGMLFTACQNEDTPTPEPTTEDLTTTEDLVFIQNLADEIDYVEDEALTAVLSSDEISPRSEENECLTITVEPNDRSFPRTVTVDFGEDGCEGPRGHILKGKIVITVSDSLFLAGATRTVSFENFFVDEAQIEGSRKLTNIGRDENNNVSRSREVNIIVTYPNGSQASWNAAHTLTQLEGGETPRILRDDVFELTGSSSGENRKGGTFDAVISEPLLKNRQCPWIQSGVRTVTVNGRTRSIDYGSGLCDRFATVTLANGETKRIVIKPWWKE